VRTIAIGDIHGCRHAFDILLEELRPASDDLVITLGDYVDRGPDSRGVIERLIKLRHECALKPLKGNHELMMLDARLNPELEKSWRHHGGRQTLESYAPNSWIPRLSHVTPDHWDFLENGLLDSFETESHCFAHANAAPDITFANQTPDWLFWEFLSEDAQPHFSGKSLIVGHTAQRSGLPKHFGHTTCIDTSAWAGGWLTALIIEARLLIQASEDGRVRELDLDDLPLSGL
jgi:serine/threonine protein phosphatase 1